MSDVLNVLLAAFDNAYKRGWHGPGLRGALRGVKAAEALWRPGKGRHNIWELTVHAAYWKYAARRKLAGGIKRGSFALKGSNWIASPHIAPDIGNDDTWRETVALLDREHRALREVIAALSPAVLDDRKMIRIVYGVIAHDVYHAGQIQLVKRLHKR